MRRLAVGIGVSAALVLSGVAGGALSSPPAGPAGTAAESVLSQVFAGGGGENQSDDAGIHGGPIERFHQGSCDLASGLPGNWTHGDYVSTVAQDGNSALMIEAAQSDCGKPMVAVDHGNGLGHATGKPESPGHSEDRGEAEEHAPEDLPNEGPVGS